MSNDPTSPEENRLIVASRFVRHRNTLFAMANFSPLYVEYYLHLKDNGLELSPQVDGMLKTALAAFSLHCVSHPRNEVLAWTINFQEPLLNLFLGGDTLEGDIVGRAYTENIKKADEGAFYQDLVRRNREPHRSVVAFQGGDVLKAVETFYYYSEQRPARFFEVAPDTFAILAAHPDYDREWFKQLRAEDILELEERETVVDLETRALRWRCGCNQRKILRVLEPVFKQDPEGLFLNEELIEVNCPRCAGKYRISREMLEAYVADEEA